jgi:phosphatidylinositol kinase/protein kinase (PI-3  family)
MFGKKIVISYPLLYRHPLLQRQLKNNQNQTNKTGAQNLKEFNNTAGWLKAHQTRRSGRNYRPISAEVALPRLQS